MKKVPVKFGNYKLRYAWVSQRGFYPEEPDKANQDAHVEVENFCADQGIEDMHLFGVFDGHGKTGTECAQWARDQVPLELAKCLKEYPDDMERSFKEAFLKVNASLHKNKQIDDKMSGTTAVVVLVNKGTLHVANVGDSRAIVAQMLDSKLTAYTRSRRTRLPSARTSASGASVRVRSSRPWTSSRGRRTCTKTGETRETRAARRATATRPGCGCPTR